MTPTDAAIAAACAQLVADGWGWAEPASLLPADLLEWETLCEPFEERLEPTTCALSAADRARSGVAVTRDLRYLCGLVRPAGV